MVRVFGLLEDNGVRGGPVAEVKEELSIMEVIFLGVCLFFLFIRRFSQCLVDTILTLLLALVNKRNLSPSNSATDRVVVSYNCKCSAGTKGEEGSQHEKEWERYFTNPEMWWDNRGRKNSSRSPDFKHKETGKALWIDNRYTPQWVIEKITQEWFRKGQ